MVTSLHANVWSLNVFKDYYMKITIPPATHPLMRDEHLMTGPKGNSEFSFLETFNVSWSEAEGNINFWRETKIDQVN